MNDMLTISSSDVRKDWSSVLDSVVRERPAFIKRIRDYMMLCTTDMVYELVSGVKFMATKYTEADGSVTLSLDDLDIVVNGRNTEEAKSSLINDIVEYAEEYYQEFDRYSNSTNRRSHLPYVIKALTAKTPRELEDAIVCQDGKI